jgi:addiction module RelE/StbE family toxin
MGYKVIWTDEAIADLRQLVSFISRDNPTAAVKLGETIIQKSLVLARHARIGKVLRKSSRETLRELSVPPYRIIYEINDSALIISIRMLWHGARQEPEIK